MKNFKTVSGDLNSLLMKFPFGFENGKKVISSSKIRTWTTMPLKVVIIKVPGKVTFESNHRLEIFFLLG